MEDDLKSRLERLEKKIDLLLLAKERSEKLLDTLEPLIKKLHKVPFLR